MGTDPDDTAINPFESPADVDLVYNDWACSFCGNNSPDGPLVPSADHRAAICGNCAHHAWRRIVKSREDRSVSTLVWGLGFGSLLVGGFLYDQYYLQVPVGATNTRSVAAALFGAALMISFLYRRLNSSQEDQ